GAVDRPPQRSTVIRRIGLLEWRVVPSNRPRHRPIAMKRRPMQRSFFLTAIHRPSMFEHHPDSFRIVVLRGMTDLPPVGRSERLNEIRTIRKQSFDGPFIAY